MSVWVKHKNPAITGDGQVCIAGPKGSHTVAMTDGAFEWPDEAGPIPSHYEVTDPSPEARERRRQELIASAEAEAEALQERLARLRGQAPAVAAKPEPEAVQPRAAEEPQERQAPPPVQAAARRPQVPPYQGGRR